MRILFTLIACAAIALPFAACSSGNDDNGDEDPTPGSTNIVKSITATTNDNGKTETQIFNFEYDSDDRLTKMSFDGGNNSNDVYFTFDYVSSLVGNIVAATKYENFIDSGTGKPASSQTEFEGRLLNGRVVNGSVEYYDTLTYTVNYDGNGYLQYLAMAIPDGRKDTVNVTWNGGNITQTDSDDKFVSTSILNNANIDLNTMTSSCYSDNLEELYPFAIIRQTGTVCKNIILDAEFDGYPVSQNYTYKTNANGYLTEINHVTIDNQKRTLVITYK